MSRDARPEAGSGVFRVSVEVSEGRFRDLLSTDVYSFRAGSSARPSDSASGNSAGADGVPADWEQEAVEAQTTEDAASRPAAAPLVGEGSHL